MLSQDAWVDDIGLTRDTAVIREAEQRAGASIADSM